MLVFFTYLNFIKLWSDIIVKSRNRNGSEVVGYHSFGEIICCLRYIGWNPSQLNKMQLIEVLFMKTLWQFSKQRNWIELKNNHNNDSWPDMLYQIHSSYTIFCQLTKADSYLKKEIIRVVIKDGHAFPSKATEEAQFCFIEWFYGRSRTKEEWVKHWRH